MENKPKMETSGMSKNVDDEVSFDGEGVGTKLVQEASSDEGKDRSEFYLKEETRKQRNRQHARVSRERKQRQFELLQEENVRLRNGIADFERQVAVNFNEIQYLRELYQRSERENLYLRGQLQGFSQVQPWPPGTSPPSAPQQQTSSSPPPAPGSTQPPQQQQPLMNGANGPPAGLPPAPLQQQQQQQQPTPVTNFYHQQQRDS